MKLRDETLNSLLNETDLYTDPIPQKSSKTDTTVNIHFNINDSTLEGGTEVSKLIPNQKMIDKIINNCSQDEKEECLKEILTASIEVTKTGNAEQLRQTLLDWEYTSIWSKSPENIHTIEDQESDDAIDWKEFLDSLENKG